jgi:hypothetical protein
VFLALQVTFETAILYLMLKARLLMLHKLQARVLVECLVV